MYFIWVYIIFPLRAISHILSIFYVLIVGERNNILLFLVLSDLIPGSFQQINHRWQIVVLLQIYVYSLLTWH